MTHRLKKNRRKSISVQGSLDICQTVKRTTFLLPSVSCFQDKSPLIANCVILLSTSTSARQVISACYRENIYPLRIITVLGPLVKHKQ